MDQLNTQQREAVAHTQGALLVLSGPGSGKTRVITHRITHIITAGLAPPSAILAVTFTNKAAREMQQRTRTLLAGKRSPVISTFHSFCVRLLRRDGAPLAEIRPGFTRRFHVFDKSDQVMVIKDCYKDLDGLKETTFMSHEDILGRISQAKNKGRTYADLLREAKGPIDRTVAAVFKAYEAALLRENALDFDDLLGETVRLLRRDHSTREAWNQRLDYVMVDEFQDTNPAQYELIRLLTQRQSNICVVGDDDQGIYSWRGATAQNISQFQRDYPNVQVIRLEQNYRSTRNIVAASRAVIEKNKSREPKELWSELPHGEPIGICAARDAEEEAAYIAHCIVRYLASCPEGHAAVLYRTNRQSRTLEAAMWSCALKYNVVGGTSFFQRAEVKDVMAYLKLATGHCDSVSLLRVINTPARKIGPAAIRAIRQYAQEKGLGLWGAIEQMTAPKIRFFRSIIADLRIAAASSSLPDLIRFIVEQTGYKAMLEKMKPEDGQSSRLSDVEELIDAAAEATERGETASDFIDYMSLTNDADAYDKNSPVSLMTLHTAKGLEFPFVFIYGMEEGCLPSSHALHALESDSGEALEEERRLFYVGMTRAKEVLILTRSRSRLQYGRGCAPRRVPSEPSSFLDELPAHLLVDLGSASPSRPRTGHDVEDYDGDWDGDEEDEVTAYYADKLRND